jgi:hypothetical protein
MPTYPGSLYTSTYSLWCYSVNIARLGLFLPNSSYIHTILPQVSPMQLLIPSHTFPCIITLHIYLTEKEAGFGCTGWRKMRRFSPVSSSYILVLSLVLQDSLYNSSLLMRAVLYCSLAIFKSTCCKVACSATTARYQTQIITLINFKINELSQNYCILCLFIFYFSNFILYSLYFLLLVRERNGTWVGV